MNEQVTGFNYRSTFKGKQIDYLASLRDSAIYNLYGVRATARIPKIENNVDEYQNFKDDEFDTQQIICVPEFTDYRQVLSQYGMSAEDNVDYPLDILIPSALHLPRNSRIILSEFDASENKVGREWRVLSTETKQLSNSKSYTKVAHCVPSRTSVLVTTTALEIECVSQIEQIYPELVHVRKFESPTTNIICLAEVSITYSSNVFVPKIHADITCTSKVRVLGPSIYNNN